jgi:hypothetical protein
MNRTGRTLAALPLAAALLGLTVAACAGGSSTPVSPPPASVHTAAEKAAVLHWLAMTNDMWTSSDFASLDQITTAEMRTIYLAEKRQASLPSNASRQAFQLTGLSITIPCQTGRPDVFVAYGDTDVFDLGAAVQPMAMVFQRAAGRWKLAAAVSRPDNGWPALCTRGAPPATPAAVAPGDYALALARVLTHAMTGVKETTAAAAPFAVNDFLGGSGSVNAQSATAIRQDKQGGVSFAGRFTPTANPTLALPLASGRGFWLIGILTQSGTHTSAAGLRAKNWPDGNQVATPRPAVVHRETDTFITTYTAIDPLRPAGNPVSAVLTLDGFFGWPLAAVAS